ncbi:FecR family protein [Rhodoferax sp. OV413]|uniref:FecR family protein n=1 Tax=Rhodoferax sp. OV413 TaxID=1855285 RepID=UPI0008877F08|nr:FecR domain-containing protein [Rhodoferax sp. OV413]SDO19249.1 FecR family protein [Rhodoferax sp. OV413]
MRPPFTPTLDAAAHVRETALDWVVRRRDAAFTEKEEQGFQAWLASDAIHREAFARWQDEWQAFDGIPSEMRHLLQRNLAFDQAMEAASDSGPRPAAPASVPIAPCARQVRRRAFLPALAGLAAVVGGSSLVLWNQSQAQPLYSQAFSTQRGQQAEQRLPDGSRVRLDTATRLEVAYYRQHREVKLLEGQAVFAVQADAERPFQVLAGRTRVTVVGTRFSVRHTPGMLGDEGVHVAVEAGRVRVEPVEVAKGGVDSSVVFLSPGQRSYSDAAGGLGAVLAVSAAGIAPWREGRVSFDNMRLDRALAEFARYRDPQLLIQDEGVAALRITGVFDPMDPATFRRVLPQSLPVRLKDVAGAIEVVRADRIDLPKL